MYLEIRQREKEGICILDLRGRLLIGGSEAMLRESIIALAKSGLAKVILNFAEAKEIDDDGLSALVLCDATLHRSGGALKLLNLSRVHIDLIVRNSLESVFEVYRDEQDAVNSFFPDRVVRHFDILEFVEDSERHPSPTPPQ